VCALSISERRVYDGDVNNGGTLASRVGFTYDDVDSVEAASPVQHDNAGYPQTFFLGRGNLTGVTRYDVGNGTGFNSAMKYNASGSVVSSKDPLSHEVKVSYADDFSDGITTHNTQAYPTTTTDPDLNDIKTEYNFDFGGITSRQTPVPNELTYQAGPKQTFTTTQLAA